MLNQINVQHAFDCNQFKLTQYYSFPEENKTHNKG